MEQENCLLVDGVHKPIVSEELWQSAQVKFLAQIKKYERVNKGKDSKVHLLSGIVKCPVCGGGMYGNKSVKHKKTARNTRIFTTMAANTARCFTDINAITKNRLTKICLTILSQRL